MKTRSAKNKGKALQNLVKDEILFSFSDVITDEDVKSTTMGESGVDIQLSTKAKEVFPWGVECKSYKAFSIYKHFDQAVENANKGFLIPLLIIKANKREPLVVMELSEFMIIAREAYELYVKDFRKITKEHE